MQNTGGVRVLRLGSVEPIVGSLLDMEGKLTLLYRRVGGNPDQHIGDPYYTFEEIYTGVHKAQNWWKTNTGKAMLTTCLGDMALYQACETYASDMGVTFDFILSKIFDVAHPSRSGDKIWVSFAPSAPSGEGLRLFGQNGMITTGTTSEEVFELANSFRLLGVSAYASHHSAIHK